MSRPKRNLQSGFCYHIMTRCNNREFRLTRLECREVFLYAIKVISPAEFSAKISIDDKTFNSIYEDAEEISKILLLIPKKTRISDK